MMIIYDFDKTLTPTDTLFGFYRAVDQRSRFFFLKRLLLLKAAIAFKLKLIDNICLKRVGCWLFLRGRSEKELAAAAKSYADTIVLNELYKTVYLTCSRDKRMIVSASYDVYLKELFPQEKVIGSQLFFKDGKVAGVSKNMYGIEKVKALKREGIEKIDCLYTDSYSDQPLMDISDSVYLIHQNKQTKIK